MEVKCPKCQTVYHLDENHIPAEGANVKCTTCHNVFKVSAPAVKPPPQNVGWHLKRPDGTVINFAHLGELQKLILEHKAHLEDMISKDGLSYKKLADMPEFAQLFIKRNQQAAAVQPVQQVSQAAPKPAAQPPLQQNLSTPPVQSVVTPISTPQQDDEIDIYGRPKKKGKKGGLLIAAGIIVIAVAVIAFFLIKDKIFGARLTEEEVSALKTAQEEMLFSDYANLERAYDTLEKFTKSPEHPPKLEILAGLAQSLVLRGELLKLENFVTEKRIKEILKVDKYSETARKLNEAFNERQRLIQDISNTTMNNLKKLDMNYGQKPLAKYVALEYIRVQVVFDRSSGDKGKELLKELKEIKDFPYSNRLKFTEGDLLLKTEESKAEEGIKLLRESASAEKGFILPYFMLARFFIAQGEYEKALSELNTVLSVSPSNTVAKALKEHTEDLLNISKTGQVAKPEESQPKDEQKKAEAKAEKEEVKKEVQAPTEKPKEEKAVKEEKPAEQKEKKEEAVAKPKAEKAVASEPKSAGNYSQLIKQAKQYAAKGQTDKAADIFLQASEIEPTLAEPFLLMGWMYIDSGKNEQAANYFLRAIKLKGNKCDGYMGLGEANKYMKRNSEAKKYYQMYLEQCPNGPDAATARNNLNTLK